ncbi:hypothetical protein [Hyalangium rubrum]|uniref:Uncharacterized protein n=1 Tax=Hyalangium rubrum TaxID=3103134 RepID=A0ABU5H2X9_9BACT|nr:hypothetical protein [Hyalangium sp. s54d21]MDY7227249.1 hypothetical protein [Hyalangium sp. s54d21]
MRTKLYVLGAVLGIAPGLLPVVSTLWGPPSQENRQDSRGASRKGRGAGRVSPAPAGNSGGVAAPPDLVPAGPGELSHPCELVTLVKVPCESSTEACEYTYWECPAAVKPLKA